LIVLFFLFFFLCIKYKGSSRIELKRLRARIMHKREKSARIRAGLPSRLHSFVLSARFGAF